MNICEKPLESPPEWNFNLHYGHVFGRHGQDLSFVFRSPFPIIGSTRGISVRTNPSAVRSDSILLQTSVAGQKVEVRQIIGIGVGAFPVDRQGRSRSKIRGVRNELQDSLLGNCPSCASYLRRRARKLSEICGETQPDANRSSAVVFRT